jgi:hypothetical protein
MDVAESIVRRSGQNGAAEQPPVRVTLGKGRVRPELIQAGEGEHILLFGVEVIRDLFPVLGLLPLVIPLRRDQRPALDGRLAERRLVQDRLAACVDQVRTDLDVLGPGRNQTQPAINNRWSTEPSSRRSAMMGTSWVGATFQLAVMDSI